MKKTRLAIIFSYIFGGIIQIQCRIYDVEAEAMKLYGENIDTVVQRFRKTPEYQKILNDKMKESNQMMAAIIEQAIHTFNDKLVSDIEQTLVPKQENALRSNYVNPEQVDLNTEDDRMSVLRRSFNRPNQFQFGYEYKIKDRLLRQDDPNVETTTLTPVEVLDAMVADTTLTVAEKNHFKDMAFQYFGEAIHAIVKGMGPEDDNGSLPSTRIVQGNTRTTTEHPVVHEVTKAEKQEESTVKPPLRSNLVRQRKDEAATADD